MVKWSEMKRERKKKMKKKWEKKEKSNWNLWCYVISLLPMISILDIFFHFPLLRKLNVSSYPKRFLSFSLSVLSLHDIIDILSTSINSIEL